MPGTIGWMICHAKRTDGTPCRAPVMRGSKVCRAHGGAAGHVREAARLRIERLVEPAISELRRVMLRGETDTVRLKAAESILDRAGIVAEQQVQVDNQVTIRVEYADVVTEAKAVIEGEVLAVSYAPELPDGNGSNGHQNGASE